MAQQTVKTRIRQKHETAENWSKATGFKPLDGELIVYNADDTQGPRLKVGDGATAAPDLPFAEAVPTGIYGVCSTAADDAAKTVVIENFKLKVGAMVIIKFTNANSIASPTLNIYSSNDDTVGTGAIPMYRYGTTAMSTGTTTTGWAAGAVSVLVYDGTGWIKEYWSNTTYSNVGLGQGYCSCSTAASTAAKTASLSSYSLQTGGIVSVKFTNAVPANATLNINSKGAKNIYFRGAKITADVIKAGDVATFIYSSYYHLISIDRWQNDITSLQSGKSKVGHTHEVTTANAAPHTHTHSVTVSGTTGANDGTAVSAVTGYGSFSGGSGSLTSDTTSTNGIKYVEAVTHTAASLTGTKTFNTDAIKDITLSASTTSTDGPAYVESVTHTAATLGGTKTFNTDAIKSVTLSASSTSTDGPKYVESISGGSGSLKSYDASTGGNAKTSSGRVPYIADVSHTAASLTGDTTFVKTQGTFSAGTTPVSSAAPKHTSTNSGSGGSATIASYSAGVLTLSNVSAHTHTYDKTTEITLTRGTAPSLGAATTGTVGISGGSIGKTTYYLDHAHTGASATTKYMKATGTAASTGTVTISGGSITPVTKYMKRTNTAASTGTVGISGGSTSSTTKYLQHSHAAASLGTPSTSSVAPSGHKHSYGSSTALTTGNNSGSAVAAVTSVAASTD